MAEQDPNTLVHTHVDENGNVITHCHSGEGHTHAHPHTHTQTKAVINRLARAIGHLESVKRMVEDGRDCAEVLIQLAAVRSALNNTAKIILKDHIDHCLADAVETGDQQAIDELNGRPAVTHYHVLERFGGAYTLVQCTLETGRTHQIRVHMASIGHPLLGDEVYGPKKCPFDLQGQCLHAQVLGFIHPRTGEYVEFSSPYPAYFEELLTKLRNKYNS